MTPKRRLPKTASVAFRLGDAKLNAPSAERNAAAIREVLLAFAPQTGKALEIASGTGQHVVKFARALPDLIWQPSDIDTARRASIDAWAAEAGLDNILTARHLDAATPGWANTAEFDLILVVNLLHLISEIEARTVIQEASSALVPNGRLFLYGPFLRSGETTSEGDARFHTSLREQDPAIGYKGDLDVIDWLHSAGLELIKVIEMPANNLCLIASRAP